MFNKSFQFRYTKKKLLLNLKLPEGLLSLSARAILDKENTYVSVVLIAEFVFSQIIQMLLLGTCLESCSHRCGMLGIQQPIRPGVESMGPLGAPSLRGDITSSS